MFCILIVMFCYLIVILGVVFCFVYVFLLLYMFCSEYCFFFTLFCVLFVCKCVLPPGVNPIAVNKYIISYHTYLLSPCSTVLLEKLTGSAASQEIPRTFGTRRFIIVLTSARHLSLS